MPVGNALVGGVLRSPLHRMMSRSVMLLTYRGQRTGKEYTIPVGYARYGEDELVVVAGRPQGKTWWTNMRGPLAVKVRLAGRDLQGEARLVKGDEAVPRLGAYFTSMPKAARGYGLQVGPGGEIPPESLAAVAGEVQVVAVRLRR